MMSVMEMATFSPEMTISPRAISLLLAKIQAWSSTLASSSMTAPRPTFSTWCKAIMPIHQVLDDGTAANSQHLVDRHGRLAEHHRAFPRDGLGRQQRGDRVGQ